MTAVRVPASSANLGPGFDALGLALDLHADVGTGEPPAEARATDEHHPATVAFRALGGRGPIWVRSAIPMSRGLGYSGAVRVGGASVAVLQRADGDPDALRRSGDEIHRIAAGLEGHGDNVLASRLGGVTVCSAVAHVQLRLGFEPDPAVVVWSPTAATTSTDRSRRTLPNSVPMADAAFNIANTAALVIGLERGDVSIVRAACADRLHQLTRFAALPESAAAHEAGVSAGAWAGWLSGSGPSVAFLCAPSRAEEVAGSLPAPGRSRILAIDHVGSRVLTPAEAIGNVHGPELRT
jgi:homoserine kinase